MHVRAVVIMVGTLLSAGLGTALAQIPTEFTNLQLLSAEIDRGQLVATMRDWAGGLGVRCNYCHVGSDNLVGANFASDDKPTKRTARAMLTMARSINRELLADLPTVENGQRHQVVSCYTCHRGVAKPPQNIGVALGAIYGAGGIDAATAEYRRLRDEHFARGRYDLSESGLVGLAQTLVELGIPADAVPLLRMGLEFYPSPPI